MSHLFDPFTLRGTTFPNRIAVSPMCQYSAPEGRATDWHLVHYGGLAQGGAGLVLTEAVAVGPEGRISPQDLGLWDDSQIEPLARVTRFIASQGAVPGIQLAHAGRKACTPAPWRGISRTTIPLSEGGWTPVAPSALAFDEGWATPIELSETGVAGIIRAFAEAAQRALDAGFQVLELHAAHGYLLHQFLSPLTNERTDRYGGSFENRTRLLRELVQSLRCIWPERLPLFVRLSATDWAEGGWDLEQSIGLAKSLKPLGADLMDVSSGGLVPRTMIPVEPLYQVPLAQAIRAGAEIPAGAVGLITEPGQAEQILAEDRADLVFLGRELLRDPRWPLRAAMELDQATPWPAPYARAARPGTPIRS